MFEQESKNDHRKAAQHTSWLTSQMLQDDLEAQERPAMRCFRAPLCAMWNLTAGCLSALTMPLAGMQACRSGILRCGLPFASQALSVRHQAQGPAPSQSLSNSSAESVVRCDITVAAYFRLQERLLMFMPSSECTSRYEGVQVYHAPDAGANAPGRTVICIRLDQISALKCSKQFIKSRC